MTTFVRIADSGSISRAARLLGLSVAMASRHLRWLEEELGVPLMRRTTRRIDLTEAGQEFLARARSLLAGLDEAKEVVRPGRGAAGRVVISMPIAFGLGRIAPLIPALLEKHPRLRVDLRFEDRQIDLLGDGIDIAIRAGARPADSPFLVARRLTTFDRVVCASPQFLARHGPIETVARLADVPCLIHGPTEATWSFETPSGPQSVVVDGRMRSNNFLALRDAVVAGAGVAWLPGWLAEDDLRRRRLTRLLEGAVMSSVEVLGLFHTQARGAGAIRAVLDHLAAELARGKSR